MMNAKFESLKTFPEKNQKVLEILTFVHASLTSPPLNVRKLQNHTSPKYIKLYHDRKIYSKDLLLK